MKPSFTLIELIIVIGIITLFSGFSLAMYNDFTETKKLEAETKKFVEVLELAKKKINSGDKPTTCDTLLNYKVTYSTNAYQVFAQCFSSIIQIGSSIDLPLNIILTVSPPASLPDEVIFKPFGLGVDLGVGVVEKNVLIKNNNNSKCRQINIKNSGVINEQKTACL